MKNYIKALFLSSTLVSIGAFAAKPTDTISNGEIFIGFYASNTDLAGGGQNFITNLGSYTQFDDRNGQKITFSTKLLTENLVSTYGVNWNSRDDISWAVSGGTTTTPLGGLSRNTIFATSPTGAVIGSNGNDALALVQQKISGVATLFNSTDTTLSSTFTVVVPGSLANSMYALQVASGPTPQFGLSNTKVAVGTTVSDFYGLAPTDLTATTGNAAKINGTALANGWTQGSNYLGSFTLDASGLSFTASGASAVPEPSTYAALAGAAVLGLVAYRRRQARA